MSGFDQSVRMLPILDATRCTGSGRCVRVCPTDCLEQLASRTPWLARPMDCIGCAACELVCPVEAIRVSRPDVERAVTRLPR
jgi:NAD-dependent dihydropyrimidine dehydrogenase PreA subunit